MIQTPPGMKSSTQRVWRVICSIYGLLLLAYPVDFRRKFGREMMLMLKSRTHDVLENGTGADLAAFVVHTSGDWAITALKENAMTGALVFRLRWIFALPLAIAAANAVARLSVFLFGTFHSTGPSGASSPFSRQRYSSPLASASFPTEGMQSPALHWLWLPFWH